MSRGLGVRAMVGVCGSPVEQREGRGMGVIVRWGVLCRCMCPLAAARLRGQL